MGKDFKDSDFGLKILREGENDSVDIIAVPGIGAHPDRTWTMKRSDDEWVNWLTDADMLPKRLPNARIMRFGYRSEWFGSKEVETKQTRSTNVAETLLKELERYRKDPRRPLLFVAHSFGGHVVMYALRRSFDLPNEWGNPFDSTAGVVFLGTPFRGRSGHGSLSEMVKTIRQAHPDYQIWQETMEMSVPGNPFLLETVKGFLGTRVARSLIPIACFYEENPSPLWKALGTNDPEKEKEKVYVVPQESACIDDSPGIMKPHGLDRNHYNLNKFCQAEDPNYWCVADEIGKMAEGAVDLFKKNKSRVAAETKSVDKPIGMEIVEKLISEGTKLLGVKKPTFRDLTEAMEYFKEARQMLLRPSYVDCRLRLEVEFYASQACLELSFCEQLSLWEKTERMQQAKVHYDEALMTAPNHKAADKRLQAAYLRGREGELIAKLRGQDDPRARDLKDEAIRSIEHIKREWKRSREQGNQDIWAKANRWIERLQA